MGEEEKELQADIDGMLDDLVPAVSGEDEEEEDKGEEVSDEEDEDKEATEADEEDAEDAEDEEGDSGEKGTPDDVGETEEDELAADKDDVEDEDIEEKEEDKDATIARLREELAGSKKEEEEEEEIVEEEKVEEFSVLGDEDLDDVLDDKDKFNAVMGKALEGFGNMLMKKFLTSMPTVVMKQVRQQTAIRSAVDAFYEDNEDLTSYKKLVGASINEVVSEHPDWKMDKVFEEGAKKTRKVLGLKEVAKKSKTKSKKNPSFAKPRGKSVKSEVKSKPTKLQKDIDDMLDVR